MHLTLAYVWLSKFCIHGCFKIINFPKTLISPFLGALNILLYASLLNLLSQMSADLLFLCSFFYEHCLVLSTVFPCLKSDVTFPYLNSELSEKDISPSGSLQLEHHYMVCSATSSLRKRTGNWNAASSEPRPCSTREEVEQMGIKMS